VNASFSDNYRAIIFDMDGTLLDTLMDIGSSMNSVLGRMGFPPHKIPAYKQFVGEGLGTLVRKALPKHLKEDEALVVKCIPFMRDEYQAHCTDATTVYPGVAELLEALQAKRIPVAVLSNKPGEMVRELLEKYFPSISFFAGLGASDEFPRKPHPAAALSIAQRLNIPPACFIFLGDSKTDMETAIAAGMYPVGALWGFRDARELLDHGAKTLIKQPQELLTLL
jgi:phosphoglycolate phosphatase